MASFVGGEALYGLKSLSPRSMDKRQATILSSWDGSLALQLTLYGSLIGQNTMVTVQSLWKGYSLWGVGVP